MNFKNKEKDYCFKWNFLAVKTKMLININLANNLSLFFVYNTKTLYIYTEVMHWKFILAQFKRSHSK